MKVFITNNSWLAIALLSLVAGLSGCSNNMGELEAYVESVKANPPGEIPPIPEIRTYETYVYPGHERDPFDTNILVGEIDEIVIPGPSGTKIVKKRANSVPPPDKNRSREYLEGFALDSLAMVGTLNQKGQLWALIKTTDGTIQRVAKGNFIGKNYGKISEITDSDIKLVEKVPDRLGSYIKRDAAIAINEVSQ